MPSLPSVVVVGDEPPFALFELQPATSATHKTAARVHLVTMPTVEQPGPTGR